MGRYSAPEAKGFALIEVLVAVSVLAICLVVILQLFSGGLKSRKLSEAYARGIFHARAKMAEILIEPEPVEGMREGEFEDAYAWRAEILRRESEVPEEDLPVALLDIRVRVIWREGEKQKEFALSTTRLISADADTNVAS